MSVEIHQKLFIASRPLEITIQKCRVVVIRTEEHGTLKNIKVYIRKTMKDIIEIQPVNIKNNKFGLVILNDKDFSNPYRIAIYSSGLEYYEYYEQKSSHGLKTIVFPLKSSTIYTIAVHDLHHKLLVLKYYKESGEEAPSRDRTKSAPPSGEAVASNCEPSLSESSQQDFDERNIEDQEDGEIILEINKSNG
jgi:hypothetical protein